VNVQEQNIAVGLMNLIWMAALALLLVEKNSHHGRILSGV
jgi:predicted metal-binding membrane protein